MPVPRSLPRFRPLALAALTLLALAPARIGAAPYRFPATPDGAPPTWRDERVVAPYLAAWKAQGLARARRLARPATANQMAYDVHYYDLDLAFPPGTILLSGTVRMRATVTSGPLSSADLDMYAALTVDAVTAGGVPASYSHAGDLLTVSLDRAYATGETFEVSVTYHGDPTTGGSFGTAVPFNRLLIWSLSEPFGARSWWPCKDDNADKADSVDIRFTAPSGLITASNGTRVSATDDGVLSVTRWRERYPIAPYLVSITSYPYSTYVDWYRPSPADSVPIQFYNYPETVLGVLGVQAKVKDMIAAFAADFGAYPFAAEKYGHAQFEFGGGMEHQTCTSLGVFNEWVVAHELAHQWWGDMVTCRDFHHIWLNEGFATYGEALWSEAIGGPAAYHADIDAYRYYGPGTIYVPDLTDPNRIFDSNLSYAKGGWVLHMLRHVLGDAVFFDALRAYGAQFRYGTATTEDFEAVCEAVSGRDLTKFFQQWIHGEYYPAYRFAWSAAPVAGGYDVTLTLEQTQSAQLFAMPVDVAVTTGSGAQIFVVPDSLASQTFVLHVDSAPTAVAIDPDGWILRTVETRLENPPLDRGVLVVNGVDWSSYGTEITGAYADRAFWGAYPIAFWDLFPAPAGGYPVTLPPPLGHGALPPDTLGHYRCVVWVGNDYNGDLPFWINAPILSYLESGGNVLLMTRMGDQFLTGPLRDYLGVSWAAGTTLYDCVASRPAFTSIARLGAQSACVVFDTTLAQPESQVIYKAVSGYTPQRGIGAIRIPPLGGLHRRNGAQLAFLSGRPYRWDHFQLRANVMTLLGAYFHEPLDPTAVHGDPPAPLALAPARPDPFSGSTSLGFMLPRDGRARLEVLDAAGRRVRTLLDASLRAGPHQLTWDGRDGQGRALAAGVYWTRVTLGAERAARRVVLVR